MLATEQLERAAVSSGLHFKAYEIEELADVYFFRPLGLVIARCSQALHATPNQLSILSGLIGVIGGALLYKPGLGLLGFALLILHGIGDSADGQLARMTGNATNLGKVLDSISGHFTYAAIYIAIVAGILVRGGSWFILLWASAAAVANFFQAQLYVYYRAAYEAAAIHGLVPHGGVPEVKTKGLASLVRGYEMAQRKLIGRHAQIEAALSVRSSAGVLDDEDRSKYRKRFYLHVRGWNLLGDNTRFYAIGVLALFHRLDWFFAFILIPMNLAAIILWLWQQRDDKRFLGEL